jgi:precorrin-2 methylase
MTRAGARIRRSCLPVVGTGGKLAGTLRRADVLSVFRRPDEQIRREIIEKVITGAFHADPASFTVTADDGVVTLQTTARTAAIGRKITTQLRHIEGVVAVRELG